MATKNTRDNTYYSLAKGFQFSSIISILAPLVYIILELCHHFGALAGDAYTKGMIITGSIAFAFAAIWVVLSFVMFFTAGNLRGIKSPLGIRAGLLIAIILVSASEIVAVLTYAKVIPALDAPWDSVLNYATQVIVLIGYIIGAGLSSSIKKALRS